MPVYDTTDRLARLYSLLHRVQAEIATIEAEQARRARQHQAARARAELARAAPSHHVRAWARNQGIPVSDVGQLPTSLRKQYINRTNNQKAGTPQ